MNELIQYFENFEIKNITKNDVILWPGTPINDQEIQKKIKYYYGIEDNSNNELSRPKKIIHIIKNLNLSDNFSIIDICCGDAIILCEIKKQFKNSISIGIDINKDNFLNHINAYQLGIQLYNYPLQEIIKTNLPIKSDLIMMLNTFRDWNSANLRNSEKNLPDLVENWLLNNSKYIIITLVDNQINAFLKKNLKLEIIGPGELNSKLVLIRN